MTNEKKWGDKEVAAFGVAAVMFVALVSYWVSEVDSTVELLTLAYGSFNLFNNPLVF
jgi:hypothetical protein